jgi:hypothetical protein
MMNHVREVIKNSPPGTKFGAFELQLAGTQGGKLYTREQSSCALRAVARTCSSHARNFECMCWLHSLGIGVSNHPLPG